MGYRLEGHSERAPGLVRRRLATSARAARRGLAAGVLLLSVLAAPAAAGAGGSELPLRVSAASLEQRGQQLVWQVHLARGISVRAMKRQGRRLCLLIAPYHRAREASHLCVTAPEGNQGRPRVVYRSAAAKHPGWHIIHAAVKRPSSAELAVSFRPAEVGLSYQPVRWQVLSSVRPPRCIAPAQDPSRCSSSFPRRPRLARLHTPRLVGCVPTGGSLIYHGPSNRHEIAFTFDDGPWNDPPTIDFLRVLERYHVPATFFEIGEQIGTYDPSGSLERRMLADGDMIGDHTWTHPNMTQLSPSEQRSQLLMTADAIERATRGFRPCLWRPPYGSSDSQLVSLARSLGFLTIQWDVDTVDWSQPGTATIYQRAVSGAHNGAIILQHFGGGPRSETLAALPHEIRTLRHRGYHFVTVAQLLGLRLIYK